MRLRELVGVGAGVAGATSARAVIEWPVAAGPRQHARSFVVALRRRFVAPALRASLVLVLAACGGGDKDKDKLAGLANTPCGGDITQTASTQLPSDVPAPSGASSAYNYFAQGATKVWYFAIDGGPGDLTSLRDTYDQALQSKGYKIEGTDQEENAEAESEFSGAHDGTTNFRPLCKGKDVLRIKLDS